MTSIRQNDGHIQIKLLKDVAPEKAAQLDELLVQLNPNWETDPKSERLLFTVNQSTRTIRIGVPCITRLEAHAQVAGIFLSLLLTPGHQNMGVEELKPSLLPAEHLLNWAVCRDLQQWLKASGMTVNPEDFFEGMGKSLPAGFDATLSETQRLFGHALARIALAFILLHEIGHLKFSHTACEGFWSIQQEKDADRFAADWLLHSASQSQDSQARRINALYGIAVALIWLTLFNVYFGPAQSKTHPEGYDRLFQTLDTAINQHDSTEAWYVWDLVRCLLFAHMDNFEIEMDEERMQGHPREQVNYMIDLLSVERF